jgi:hypothetical protein
MHFGKNAILKPKPYRDRRAYCRDGSDDHPVTNATPVADIAREIAAPNKKGFLPAE